MKIVIGLMITTYLYADSYVKTNNGVYSSNGEFYVKQNNTVYGPNGSVLIETDSAVINMGNELNVEPESVDVFELGEDYE